MTAPLTTPAPRDLRGIQAWARAREVARQDAMRADRPTVPRTGDDGRCAMCNTLLPIVCAGLCFRCNRELDASARGDA